MDVADLLELQRALERERIVARAGLLEEVARRLYEVRHVRVVVVVL